MPIDIAALAGTLVTSFLLPYVKDGAKKIAESLTKDASTAGAHYVTEVAQKTWDHVKSVFTSDREKATLADFEEDPDATKELMTKKLKNKMEQDPSLKEKLDQLVNAPGPEGKSALQFTNIVGEVNTLYMPNANFSGAKGVRLAGKMTTIIGKEES